MSRYLHGGGVPFVADLAIDQIASLTRFPEKLMFRAFPAGGPQAERSLLAEVTDTKSPDPRGRAQFKVTLQPDTLGFLGRANAIVTPEARAADAQTASYPKFYYRIVDTMKCGGESKVSEPTLRALAEAMRNDTAPQAVSNIPAAYTYLGQFIAHDMTHMSAYADYGKEINLRSHALDLDSLFGAIPPEGKVSGEVKCTDGVCIGQTSAGRYEDLPRSATGFPCIADPRNDNNLAVAQLTVAMMKFHQRVCELTKGCSSEEQRTITRRHVQSVVLHDYLPRIIDPDVYCDVMHHGGRKVIFPTDEYGGSTLPGLFQVPVEFAAACFRFGHSMVRHQYDWTDYLKGQGASWIRRMVHLGFIKEGVANLKDDWVVDWQYLLGNDPSTQPERFSLSIQSQISGDLTQFSLMDKAWIDPTMFDRLSQPSLSLAELSLLRGNDLALTSGERLRDLFADKLDQGSLIPKITPQQMFAIVKPRLRDGEDEILQQIECRTPLWFYTLREAELHGHLGRLGPVASRVVMETVHASICASGPDNLFSDDFHVLQEIQSANPRWLTLGELLLASSTA